MMMMLMICDEDESHVELRWVWCGHVCAKPLLAEKLDIGGRE
jgi:hypothetical protein